MNRISFTYYHGNLQVMFQESKDKAYGIGFIGKYSDKVTFQLNENPPRLTIEELETITAKMRTL